MAVEKGWVIGWHAGKTITTHVARGGWRREGKGALGGERCNQLVWC